MTGGWVQAQRLRIVTEQASGATVVHLDRAGAPAPSWAALGWLETSIRSYAKFVDVAARATSTVDGEAGVPSTRPSSRANDDSTKCVSPSNGSRGRIGTMCYNEVVQPLANEGAEVYCQVVIIAKGDAAIRENTVELGIKESLSQRGIEAEIQTG
jgi:hypothetical protein